MDRNTIVYITDDRYVDYTLLSIKSVLSFSKSPLDIKIVCNGVAETDRKKMLVADCISLIDYGTKSNIETYKKHRHVSNSAFIKFDIPSLVDDDTCLYVDGDTVASNDISTIFDYDISMYLIGVVKDFCALNIVKTADEGCVRKRLFNTGVMLMNLKKMREGGLADTLHKTKRSDVDGKFVTDQEVYNHVLGDGDVLYLPPKYNLSTFKIAKDGHWQYRDVSLYNSTYGTDYPDMEHILADAVINHFHGNKEGIYGSEYFKGWVEKIGLED